MNGFLERLTRGLLAHPRAVLAVSLLVLGLGVAGLTRLRIDSDLEHLLAPGDPTLTLTRQLQGDARPSRTLFLVFRADRAERLEEALPAVVERLRNSPLLARVSATRAEFAGPRYEWHRRAPLYALPAEAIERLRDRLAGTGRKAELESSLKRMAEDPLAGKELAKRDPLGVRWVFDEAGDRMGQRFPARLRAGSAFMLFEDPALAFVRLIGKGDSFNLDVTKEVLADVRGRLGERPSGVTVELAGGYVTAEYQATRMRADMILQTTSSMILVMLYLHLLTRSLWLPFFLVVPLGVATVSGLALGGLLLGPMTPLVISVAAMLIGLGIDFPIHFYSRFREERDRQGRDEAILASQLSLGRPFLGAAATTLAAFLAFQASAFPGFRQFGAVLCFGYALCLLTSMTLFPVLLLRADRFGRKGSLPVPAAAAPSKGRPALALAVLGIGLAGWGTAFAGRVRVDLDLRRSMPPGDPTLAVFERLEAQLGVSLMPVFALVDRTIPLEELRTRTARLREAGLAGASDGPQDLFPSAEAAARADAFRAATRGWVEGTLADLKGAGFRPEPFRKGLEEMDALLQRPPGGEEALSEPEFAGLRALVEAKVDGTLRRVVTIFPKRSLWYPEDRKSFDRGVREVLGGGVDLYSAFHLPDHYAALLMGDLKRVGLLTGGGVLLLALLSAGSLGDGLRALTPVLLAAGATFGVCAWMGGAVNLMNVVAFPIIVGIGVDAGIHVVCRYRATGRRDPLGAVRECLGGLGGAAATTVIGFGSIATSGIPGLASMGLFVAAGTIVSFAAAVAVLPALLPRRDS